MSLQLPAARRSLIALLLAAALLPLVMSLAACLNVPVGDPEASKVDPKLSGAWVLRDGDKEKLYIVKPFDGRAYMVKNFVYNADGSEYGGVYTFKAWLTNLGGATFITLEPMLLNPYAEKDENPIWLVGRVTINGDSVEMKMVTAESPVIKAKEPKTREAVEQIIRENLDNPGLYKDTLAFHRADADKVKTVLEAFKIEHGGL